MISGRGWLLLNSVEVLNNWGFLPTTEEKKRELY